MRRKFLLRAHFKDALTESFLIIRLLLLCDNNKLFIIGEIFLVIEFARQLIGICWVYARWMRPDVDVTTITETQNFSTLCNHASHPPTPTRIWNKAWRILGIQTQLAKLYNMYKAIYNYNTELCEHLWC